LVPKSDLVWLAKKLLMHDCILIIDESFIDFAENSDQVSLEQEIENYPNIVIFKSIINSTYIRYSICFNS
jgi:histidinol-phosphate/aromatic aminotransferase/cobyric acid decarboxylase-like protein